MSNTIFPPISQIPLWSDIANDGKKSGQDYERFFNEIYSNVGTLQRRQFAGFLANPDFNLLSANVLNPVTELSANNTEIVDKWFVFNAGGTNAFTLTPTAYSSAQNSDTGSLYYLNCSITNINTDFYLYNQNYSTTNQFNSTTKYSNKTVTFSALINNIAGDVTKLRFSAFANGYGLIESEGIFLTDGLNAISTTLFLPDFAGNNFGVEPWVQFRLNFVEIYSALSQFDIYYIKAEFSNQASYLEINHILEEIYCNALI